MTVVEVHEGHATAREVAVADQAISAADRVRQSWPSLVVGVGLVATVVWMTVLSWMLYRAVLILI